MTAPLPGTAPGAPDTGGTPAGQAPAVDPQPKPGQQPAPGAPDKPADDVDTEPQDVDSLPDWARKRFKKLSDENAKHRTDKQTSAQAAEEAKRQRAAVLKAFGLAEDGSEEPLTEAQLGEKITEAQDAAWAMGVENVLLRNKDVDAGELLDSRAFLNSLDDAGLTDRDPRETGFADDLAAHVATYVEKHPKFKAKADPPGAARSGGDHPGGPAAPGKRPTSLGAAVASEYAKRRGGK